MQFDVRSDENGGAYLVYSIPHEFPPYRPDSLYLAHFDSQGQRLWEKSFDSPGGGAVLNDYISVNKRGNNVFVLTGRMKYLSRITYDGDILWKALVTSRDTIFTLSYYHGLQADELGGCIVVWHELGSRFGGFRVQRIDQNGNFGRPVAVSSFSNPEFAGGNEIQSIWPNPFNAAVTIRLLIRQAQPVNIKVFNIMGKEVVTLKKDILNEGEHVIYWQGTDQNARVLPSGIYFLLLQTGSKKVSRKFLIIR
jgi:hypothetical protein